MAIFKLVVSIFFITYLAGCREPARVPEPHPLPVSGIPSLSLDSSDMVLAWYELELSFIRQKPGFAPPVAARSLGYLGVTLYESFVNGMSGYQSLSRTLEIPDMPSVESTTPYHWMSCGNRALAFALRHYNGVLSDTDLTRIDSLENFFKVSYSKEVSGPVLARSISLGEAIASAIYNWSLTDGGHDAHIHNFKKDSYQYPQGGTWVPTSYVGALLPDWGNNRAFLKKNIDSCQPPPPPNYSDEKNSLLYREALEVYQAFQMLTDEQADIAKFWADTPGSTFTPAGHSIIILMQVVKQEKLSAEASSIAFAKAGIALNDAFISCWNAKYRYSYVRPITYIRKHFKRDWLPFLTTPPFPEYPSGHSVQAGAMAEVMSSLFGDNYEFTDVSNDTLGYAPRHYGSFNAYAEEAAISRLYGGIHFTSAIKQGLNQGRLIGTNVNRLKFQTQDSENKLTVHDKMHLQ